MVTDPEKTDKNDSEPNLVFISDYKCTSVVKSAFCLLGSISG
jgi:hypothetical protein